MIDFFFVVVGEFGVGSLLVWKGEGEKGRGDA